MFTEVTQETLTVDILKASTEGLLLESSSDFLLKKLNQLNNSENELSDDDIKIIQKLLEFHIELKQIEWDFNVKKILMQDTLKKEIKVVLSNMSSRGVDNIGLFELKSMLKQWLFNDSRDVIDYKLNNTDLSFEWLADWFLNYEFIGKFEQTNNFLNYFTLELLDSNILVDESRNKHENQLVYSDLSIDNIKLFITNTIRNLLENRLDFPNEIEIKHWNEDILINLLEIRTNIELEIEKTRQKTEEIKLQEEKEKNNEYLVLLLEWVFNGTIDSIGLEVLNRKYGYNGNIDNWENRWYTDLFCKYTEQWLIDKNFVINLYEEWKISKIILLNYLEEEDENFNYLEFIENYWLTKRIQQQGLDYARNVLKLPKELTTEEKINNPDKKVYSDELILKNLQIFISIFLNIESKWMNVKNQQWSSAKWYFQFLTLDWKYQKKNIEKKGIEIWDLIGWSFRTWLNRTKWVLSAEEFNLRFWEQNSKKERDQNPMDLSAENQTMLFFANITGKDLYITNRWIDINKDWVISDKESITNVGIDKNRDGIIWWSEIKFRWIDVHSSEDIKPDWIIEKSEKLRYIYNSKDLDWNWKIDKPEVRISKRWVDINKNNIMESNEVIKKDPREVARFMEGVLKNNNEWSLWKIYKALHHTSPTSSTLRVFRETINSYYYWDKKYIAKNHY